MLRGWISLLPPASCSRAHQSLSIFAFFFFQSWRKSRVLSSLHFYPGSLNSPPSHTSTDLPAQPAAASAARSPPSQYPPEPAAQPFRGVARWSLSRAFPRCRSGSRSQAFLPRKWTSGELTSASVVSSPSRTSEKGRCSSSCLPPS